MAKRYFQLSKILSKLLYERRMNPSDLARAVNLPPPTIHRLVTGKSTRPYESSLKPIADYFSINIEQLLGEEPLPEWVNSDSAVPAIQNAIKLIPVISWEGANNIEEAKTKSKNQIAIVGNVNDDCFALMMNDHSMDMLFPRKTLLVFDPHKKPTDRSYVLVKLEGKDEPIFRQLLVDIDHKYLKPLNPDLSMYKMRLLDEKDLILACLLESRINHAADQDNNMLENES